jgi:aryl-alcohol dehydrogenase-like predicted oxidoreductase
LGNWDEAADHAYREAVVRAVELGCNVIDSAINYRFQRSERVIGQALQSLFEQGRVARDEIVVATKGGYIPFDGGPPSSQDQYARYLYETFIQPGIITPEELAGGGSHCLSPRYLRNQIETSLTNLRLECIDVYYLHNPEQQLDDVDRDEFERRMRAAFEVLEEKVAEGKIRLYGTATWNGYRVATNSPGHLSLPRLVSIAKDVAGDDHHFRVIQLPYNLAMVEALTLRNQSLDGRLVSIIEAAMNFGITVMASASLLQSRLAANLPETIRTSFSELHTDAQRAIQFVRSTPGIAGALVGMSRTKHVEENLALARFAPMTPDQIMKLYSG